MSFLKQLENNDFTKWFMICVMKKYADFDGRARRKEFWMFYLVAVLVCLSLGILAAIFGSIAGFLGMIFLALYAVFGLAMVLPNIAGMARRLHDTGKSGWFILVALIPFGAFYLLYLLVKNGDTAPNKYGLNPKGLL